MMGKVTMLDVARAAEVHQTTVSLALRNHPRIPPATRERIQRLAHKMGYRVNPLVAAFVASRGRRSRVRQATLGYVSADPARLGGAKAIHDYADLLAGVEDRADALGYGVDHLWIGDPDLTPQRFAQITETRGIHGLIIAPLAEKRRSLELPWERYASVAYGYSLTEPALHRVMPDFYHNMLEILHHCRTAGHRRIGLVLTENADRKSDHFWLAAFLAEQRFEKPRDAVSPLLFPAWNERTFKHWVATEKPGVVVALDSILDLVAATPQAKRLTLISLSTNGRFKGINGDRHRAGAICVDIVVGQLHRNERGIPPYAQNVFVRSEWIEAGPSIAL